MTLARRVRMRPVLYPAAILVAFVLNFLLDTGVSPYAAGRPLIVALVIGLALPWLAGLATAERHRAGLFAAILMLLLLVGKTPVVFVLCVVALVLISLQPLLARRSPDPRATQKLWPVVTRVLTAGGLILLVAVGVKAVQLDRVETLARDLAAEFPFRPHAAVASSAVDLPSIYLLLLDGYPRSDKLQSEFGIDTSGFTRGLGDRGFFVATHSRSNYTTTRLTLAQMLDLAPGAAPAAGPEGPQRVLWRHQINEGAFLSRLRDLGYASVAVSPGFEHVALRRADRFIDTGQLNEFEWNLLDMTGVRPVIEAAFPWLAGRMHRARVLDALRVTESVARGDSPRPRIVLAHIMSPHSPQVFEADGSAVHLLGSATRLDDSDEYILLGREEYARRLAGQIAYLNGRVLGLVDAIVEADPGAVVVVFSDHGSGIRELADIGGTSDADLRTANLLALRSPGKAGLIDDRSTLVNVLPRILRAYTGSGPADVPETIYRLTTGGELVVFARPD